MLAITSSLHPFEIDLGPAGLFLSLAGWVSSLPRCGDWGFRSRPESDCGGHVGPKRGIAA